MYSADRISSTLDNTMLSFAVRGRASHTRASTRLAVVALCCFGILGAHAQVNVTTQHNDNSRTGANLNETFLTPTNVSSGNFGKLFEVTLDGQVYAQPLYVSGVSFPQQGNRNVVYVATMHNSVYALDADVAGKQYWKASFGTPVTPKDVELDGNVTMGSTIGIMGTPVIDLSTGTIYFASRNEGLSGSTKTFSQYLNALDIVTGKPKYGSPKLINATYTTADGTLTFDPKIQNQRPALTLANGNIYIAWASHDDNGPYHGWVMGYNATTLAQIGVYSDTSQAGTAYRGGIWQAGQGLTVDATGNVMFSSGNGSFGTTANGVLNTGNSFVKLSPTLALLDYFTPYNSASLNSGDSDLGSSGLLSIPGTTFVTGGGKAGVLYLVDSTNMGHFNSSQDNVQQEFRAIYGTGSQHIHGTPVFLNSSGIGTTIYVWGENDYLRAFSYNTGTNLLDSTPAAMSSMTAPMTNNNGAMPGGFLSISASGKTNGIVWASTPYSGNAVHVTVQGVLHAFDATSLAELWTDKADDARDEVGNFAKYVPPTVANGKVFVPTFGDLGSADGSGSLNVYGLLRLIPDGEYTITNVNSNMLLDVPNASTQAHTVLDQASPAGLTSQLWTVKNLGGNVITLTNVNSGLLADDNESSVNPSTPIIQYPSNGGTNQKWQVVQVGVGVYTLINLRSGFLLDVSGASKVSGAPIHQFWPHGTSNQEWTFTSH